MRAGNILFSFELCYQVFIFLPVTVDFQTYFILSPLGMLVKWLIVH